MSHLIAALRANRAVMSRFNKVASHLIKRMPAGVFTASEIEPNLFLGNVRDACHLEGLQTKRITHVMVRSMSGGSFVCACSWWFGRGSHGGCSMRTCRCCLGSLCGRERASNWPSHVRAGFDFGQTVVTGVEPAYPERFQYHHVDALDVPGEMLDFDKTTAYLESILQQPENVVFVHWYRLPLLLWQRWPLVPSGCSRRLTLVVGRGCRCGGCVSAVRTV